MAFDWRRLRDNKIILGGILFLMLMVRNCAVGMQYWPQLDDYIQYHNYAAQFSFGELQNVVGLLASRPLAGIADYFIWTPMFEYMILGVAMISALYAASVIQMKGLMERYFAVGPVFPVVMALLPLGIEGTYWMSASTRIVCGLFFACLASVSFGKWLDTGRRSSLLSFMVLLLLPFGFYEQSAVLAMTLVLGMAILEFRARWKRALAALWAIPAVGLYGLFTRYFAADTIYSSRAEFVFPTSNYFWNVFLPDILGQFKSVFWDGTCYTLIKGLVRGIQLVCSGELIVWILLPAILCLGYGYLAVHDADTSTGHKFSHVFAVLVGAVLVIAPLTPFLILANPWFSLRGAVTSLPGIAMICDVIVMSLCRWLPLRKQGAGILAALCAFVFCISGAVEIRDYKDTWKNDHIVAKAVLSRVEEDFPTKESAEGIRAGVLGVEKTTLPDQNYFWHEHIHGCTESSWAFEGLLKYLAPEGRRPSITPLPSDPIYRRWNAEVSRPWNFDVLYWYDGVDVIPVTLEKTEEMKFNVVSGSGVIGRVWEEADETGYFRPE